MRAVCRQFGALQGFDPGTWQVSFIDADSCLKMKISCLIQCIGNLIGSLKIKETDFVVCSPHSNCQFLIFGKFGEAEKISILSDDQTCHLCKVGSTWQ